MVDVTKENSELSPNFLGWFANHKLFYWWSSNAPQRRVWTPSIPTLSFPCTPKLFFTISILIECIREKKRGEFGHDIIVLWFKHKYNFYYKWIYYMWLNHKYEIIKEYARLEKRNPFSMCKIKIHGRRFR